MFQNFDYSQEFKKAFLLMEKTPKNIFLTGKAGTGKSTLLQFFMVNTKKDVAILAPTGVAALNVQGETIHSFFRFKPNITLTEAKKIAKRNVGYELYTKLKTIVIDEVSMVRADMLDYIDVFLKITRKNKTPFGGVQMIFIGDLYQLPPVVTSQEREFFKEEYASPYFFDAQVLKEKEFTMEFVELEKIYRQKDEEFIALLNAIRNNSITEDHINILNSCVDSTFESEKHIILTTTNSGARSINEYKLNKIKSKPFAFSADIEGNFDEKHYPTELNLTLKKGAQVMFLNNDPSGQWVNGTLGKITRINDEEGVIVELTNGEEVEVTPFTWKVFKYFYDKKAKSLGQEGIGSFNQLPLKLAWAITIHKSQGKTFDNVIIDFERGTFAHGQAYVALSRCRTFGGIVLKKPMKKSHIIMDWKVVRFLTSYQYRLSDEKCSKEDKVKILQKALKEGKEVEIVYLKAQDVKSTRKILVKEISEMEYMEKKFLGVRAHCLKRNAERVFRVDRILEIVS